MYLARVTLGRGATYILRESVASGNTFESRDICELGPRPGNWIDYPGGNAWYVSPELSDRVCRRAKHFDPDRLEALFHPFIRPDIRSATEAFRQRGRPFVRTTRQEKEALALATHAFDKRRAHFLKFGNMDQGPLAAMPPVLFKQFRNKCRDEIEQHLMVQEMRLSSRELKSYVYTIFDLQRFFNSFMAKKMPHVLDQDRVEAFFIKEICTLNQDLFGLADRLHPYMVRYLIMFFDHTYEETMLLEDMERDFRYRRRFFAQPARPSVSRARAREIFGLSRERLNQMDKKNLTRRFRQLARKHHPDKGGDHDRFVEINEAYQALLAKLAPRG